MIASDEVRNARMKICESCPDRILATNRCGICKCFLIAKTKFASAKCPKEKW